MKKLRNLLFWTLVITININTGNAQWYAQSLSGANVIAVNGNNIYTGSNGVQLSTDNGFTWTQLNYGALNNLDVPVYSFVFTGNNIFIGAGNYNGETTNGGVYLAANGSYNWVQLKNGMDSDAVVLSLAVIGNDLFAGTSTHGVFISTNNGNLWTAVNNGLDSSLSIASLAVIGNNIFAAADHQFGNNYSGKVFYSVNNGQLWIEADSGITADYIYSLVADGGNLFAGSDSGVFFTSNYGTSWKSMDNGLPGLCDYVLAAKGDSIYTANCNQGLFLATDTGAAWMSINNGMKNDANSVAFKGDTIIAGGDGGVSVSSNQAFSWQALDHGLPYAEVQTFDTTINGNVFAPSNGGLYHSRDHGQHWTTAINIGMDRSVSCFANIGTTIIAGTDSGMFRSLDTGNTWVTADNGLPNLEVISLLVNGSSVFAGTWGGGLYISNDTGKTWSSAGAGLRFAAIFSLAANGNYLFAGVNYNGEHPSGIFLSTNNGASWLEVNNGLDTASDIMSIVIYGNDIFAATQDFGIFHSTDNGYSWTPVNNGITNLQTWYLMEYENKMFAATVGGGVFVSVDNANTWIPMNDGITSLYVYDLAIIDGNLFAGTDQGINVRALSDFNNVAVASIKQQESLMELYPNPSEGHFTISLSNSMRNIVVNIYNLFGEEVYTTALTKSKQDIDLSHCAKGIYFVTAQGEERIFTKKIVIE